MMIIIIVISMKMIIITLQFLTIKTIIISQRRTFGDGWNRFFADQLPFLSSSQQYQST